MLSTYFTSYKVVPTLSALAFSALTFTILVLTRLLLVPFIWRLLVACETTSALKVPAIICFNYSKAEHKSCACSKL
jgi:hypothetical protein